VSPADTALGFPFLGMRVLRHCARVAAILAPDDMRQTALVFLPGDSGTVAHPIIKFQ
jgi:hypothetical protein